MSETAKPGGDAHMKWITAACTKLGFVGDDAVGQQWHAENCRVTLFFLPAPVGRYGIEIRPPNGGAVDCALPIEHFGVRTAEAVVEADEAEAREAEAAASVRAAPWITRR